MTSNSEFWERSNAIKRVMRAWLKPLKSTSASAAAKLALPRRYGFAAVDEVQINAGHFA